jgi:hypothetical protein
MLTITDEFAKLVAGKSLSAHLAEELEAFRVSSVAGAGLLDPVLKGGDAYTVAIKKEGATATLAKRVTINASDTKISIAATLDDLKEFVESTIFELSNATNSVSFASLEADLLSGVKPLRTYGTDKADLEASASWNVYKLLTQRADYLPSAWGVNQINACKGYETLESFKIFFRAQPHDARAEVAGTQAALPSEEYYAFLGAYTLGGTSKKLDNHFTKITHTKSDGKRVSLHKLMNTLPNANMINKMNLKAVTYLHVALDLLHAQGTGLTVIWKAPYEKHQFSAAMRQLAADTGGIYKSSMTKTLNESVKNILE